MKKHKHPLVDEETEESIGRALGEQGCVHSGWKTVNNKRICSSCDQCVVDSREGIVLESEYCEHLWMAGRWIDIREGRVLEAVICQKCLKSKKIFHP